MSHGVEKEVSNGICVEVTTKYQRNHSNPLKKKYLFAYQITITNHTMNTVQLLSRKWFIYDSSGKRTLVEGEGVVGKTPVLKPNEKFQYISCCPLESPLGYMKGEYTFSNIDDYSEFTSNIPTFQLVCPDILN